MATSSIPPPKSGIRPPCPPVRSSTSSLEKHPKTSSLEKRAKTSSLEKQAAARLSERHASAGAKKTMKEATNGTHVVGDTRAESVTCAQNGHQEGNGVTGVAVGGGQGGGQGDGQGDGQGGEVKLADRGEEGGAETPPLSAHR